MIVDLEVSRLERLQDENGRLHAQIGRLLERARRNEEIYRAFYAVQIHLIKAESFLDIIRVLTREMKRSFAINRTTVAISDCAQVWHTLPDGFQNFLFVVRHQHLADVLKNGKKALVRIGQEGHGDRASFFGPDGKDFSHRIRSEVLVPLIWEENLVGSLNLGSSKPTRFLPGYSTDLLHDLASVLMICLKKQIS